MFQNLILLFTLNLSNVKYKMVILQLFPSLSFLNHLLLLQNLVSLHLSSIKSISTKLLNNPKIINYQSFNLLFSYQYSLSTNYNMQMNLLLKNYIITLL